MTRGYASPLQLAGFTLSPTISLHPKELSKFRGFFCLALQRIQEPATWKDVERNANPIGDNAGRALVVPGKLWARDLQLFTNHYVRLVITSDTVDERNALMDAIRIRTSPCQLVYRRMKEVLLYQKLSDKVLKTLSVC